MSAIESRVQSEKIFVEVYGSGDRSWFVSHVVAAARLFQGEFANRGRVPESMTRAAPVFSRTPGGRLRAW